MVEEWWFVVDVVYVRREVRRGYNNLGRKYCIKSASAFMVSHIYKPRPPETPPDPRTTHGIACRARCRLDRAPVP